MALLKIIKLSTKTWKHNSDVDGDFILTKFYAKQEDNEFLLVETYGSKRRKYLISEIEVYDIGGTAETFSNFTDLFLRLEELKYPAFYIDGEVDLSTKVDKVSTAGVERAYIINADGSQGTKATSDFKDVLEFTDLASFPITGETGKIYLALDTNKTYRWTGSAYVQIGGVGTSESDLYRSFFQYSARNDGAGIVALNAPVALVTSGTQSLVNITGISKYTSIPLQNYLSATPNGSNCGWKQGNLADGVIRQGFDIYLIWANNDANSNCQTLVGSYSLTGAIPNLAVSSFTGDFFGVSNDVGDTNLSFYAHRVPIAGQTASYTKVATNSSFPAHDTTSAYMLRMEAPCTEVDADRYIKMTLTNIITGATISHTFPYTETPVLNRVVLCVINRNNSNTGVATNIRPSKIHYSRLIY